VAGELVAELLLRKGQGFSIGHGAANEQVRHLVSDGEPLPAGIVSGLDPHQWQSVDHQM
jgi:hypothetical protein